MTGSPKAQNVLSIEDAIDFARNQRDQLVAGADALLSLDISDTSDEAYAKLQAAMEKAAPKLAHDGWAHKYWFLISPDRIDDYHSPRYQRFHLFKILQMPPDGIGILEALVLKLQNTVAVNFAGNPALALPIPLIHDKVHVTSLQLVGPPRSEAALLNAGRFVETSTKK